MQDDRCIVYYHGNDWDGVRARQRYLMEALSRHIPVVYLDKNWDSDKKVKPFAGSENVTVVRGVGRWIMHFASRKLDFLCAPFCWWHLRWIRAKYRKIIFICAENAVRPYRYISHDHLIFDCIDPCFNREPEALAAYEQREHTILKDAGLVFASADTLRDACKRHNANVTLINNACAPEDYSADLLEAATIPAWWPTRPGKVAAYLGSLDWRFDTEVLLRSIQDHPEVNFILAGKVLKVVADKIDALEALPNVTVPGLISVEDGRYLLSKCDIGLIPFTPGEMNDAINPVKMYAYAYLGKAMAGTAVHELTTRPDVVSTGSTPADFSAAVAKALQRSDDPAHGEMLKEFARENTWDNRGEQAWEQISRL